MNRFKVVRREKPPPPQTTTEAAKAFASSQPEGSTPVPEAEPEAVSGQMVTINQRSLMLCDVEQQVAAWTYAEPDRPWLNSFYLERGVFYGLFSSRGQLFRAAIDVGTDGHTVEIGTMESVMHQFTPVSRSLFTTQREDDGRTRFFMVAGTAVVNRIGEIDSTKLYDDMIRRAEETGFYPTLDFWHLGDVDPAFEFGQFDYLARDGVVYVGSGLLLPGHPLAIALEDALQRDAEYWGASIEYYRPQERGIEYIRFGELEIPVLTEGLNTRISVLPERAAASWFTQLSKELREMDPKKLKALRTMFGDNEAGFNEFIASIASINAEVRDKGIVSRSAEPKGDVLPPEGDAAPEAEAEGVPALTGEVELDDAAIQAIVEVARTQIQNDVLTTVTAGIEVMTANMTKLLEQQTAMLGTVNGLMERVGTLEQTDEQKQRTWQQDLPAKTQNPLRVTYRPRTAAAEEEVQRTAPDQAAAVLAKLPKVGF